MKYIVATDEEPLATACKMYWETDEEGFFTYKIAEIVKETGLSQPKINNAATQHTAAFSEETSCMDCGQPYEYKNRSDYQNLDEGRDWRCESCLEAIAFDKDAQKKESLTLRYKRQTEPGFTPMEMPFDLMAKLLALLKHSASEDMATIMPLADNNNDQLSPNGEYTTSIITLLLDNEVITFDPESRLDRIIFNDDGSTSYYPMDVNWLVACSCEYANLGQFYISLEEQLPELLRLEGGEELVTELCLQECLAYLEHILDEHGLPFKPGEKTRLVLEKGLQHFSVSQMYAVIWSTGSKAASYYMRGNVPKQQAANSVVSRMDAYIDRALAENWDVKPYRRLFDLPQSVLSRLVFNSLLGTSDGGFNMRLNELLELAKSDLDKAGE